MMGIILTAGMYFLFGLVIGVFLMSFVIGYVYYGYREFNEPNSKRAIDDLYDIGKAIHDIRKNH